MKKLICFTMALCVILSTALFCMTIEEGKNLINTIPNTETLWLTKDGQIHTTTGWDEYVK